MNQNQTPQSFALPPATTVAKPNFARLGQVATQLVQGGKRAPAPARGAITAGLYEDDLAVDASPEELAAAPTVAVADPDGVLEDVQETAVAPGSAITLRLPPNMRRLPSAPAVAPAPARTQVIETTLGELAAKLIPATRPKLQVRSPVPRIPEPVGESVAPSQTLQDAARLARLCMKRMR